MYHLRGTSEDLTSVLGVGDPTREGTSQDVPLDTHKRRTEGSVSRIEENGVERGVRVRGYRRGRVRGGDG